MLSEEGRTTLTRWARSRTGPARLVTRARIVLAAAEGRENPVIAADPGLARGTVATWRQRFAAQRVVHSGYSVGLGSQGLRHFVYSGPARYDSS